MFRIGCGFDGLNWDIVKSLIIKYKSVDINIKNDACPLKIIKMNNQSYIL